MILALQTSDATCRVWISGHDYIWEANRMLAHGLLAFIERCLKDQGVSWSDITGLAVYRGPGSFTGLRIGITVMNTMANALTVPIVGETGDDWRERAEGRLTHGENETIVLPEYGGAPHITQPRK